MARAQAPGARQRIARGFGALTLAGLASIAVPAPAMAGPAAAGLGIVGPAVAGPAMGGPAVAARGTTGPAMVGPAVAGLGMVGPAVAGPAAVLAAGCAAQPHSDPLTSVPWPLQRLRPELAWPLSRGKGEVVAVIDSGV